METSRLNKGQCVKSNFSCLHKLLCHSYAHLIEFRPHKTTDSNCVQNYTALKGLNITKAQTKTS